MKKMTRTSRAATTPRTGATKSRSQTAVEIMLVEGASLRAAAARVGVSAQAVHQLWKRTRGAAPTPVTARQDDAADELRRLVAQGVALEAIAKITGRSRRGLRGLARRRGIPLRSERDAELEEIAERIRRAVESVSSGRTLGEASREHGVRYKTLFVACQKSGVRPRSFGWSINVGSATRAADAVQRGGSSVTRAAQEEGCAPQSVSRVLAERSRRAAEIDDRRRALSEEEDPRQ